MPKEKFLTNRQKEFAKFIVEGTYSNAECARKFGYSEVFQAAKTASLCSMVRTSHWLWIISKNFVKLREKKYGVSLLGQLKRFADLSRGAEESGQFSAAVNAEKIRSALGGLAIDKRETNVVHQLDKLSREEIISRLSEIRKAYPSAFIEGDYEVVGEDKGRKPSPTRALSSNSRNCLVQLRNNTHIFLKSRLSMQIFFK